MNLGRMGTLLTGLMLFTLSVPALSMPDSSENAVICINTGGGQFTDSHGTTFEADSFFSGGRIGSYNHEIAETTDDILFNSERWGNFNYSIPLNPGDYWVTLYFAEVYFQSTVTSGGPGTRVFDIFLENQLVETDFDILAHVPSKTAMSRTYETTVADGDLTVSFARLANEPKLSGLCVHVMASADEDAGDNVGPTPPSEEAPYEMCINAAGPAYTATDGTLYHADDYFSGGRKYSQSYEIANTDDDLIYQTERWRDFSYSIPVPGAGVYTVELEFAEIYYQALLDVGGPGSRVFDIYIEEEMVAPNFDILAQAPSKTALTLTHSTLVEDGSVDVAFGVQIDWPKLSALCVRGSLGETGGDGDDGGDSGDGGGDGGSDPVDPEPGEPNDENTDSFGTCINAGGPAYTAGNGLSYAADSEFSGGRQYKHEVGIANTDDDTLFQSERWGNFNYSIPVPANGSYNVALMFAEIYFQSAVSSGGPGARVFDIYLEGEQVRSGFDIIGEVGSEAALIQQYSTEVTDGKVDISFGRIADEPKLSALCVFGSDGGAGPGDGSGSDYYSDPFDVLFVKGTEVVNTLAKAQALIDNPDQYENVRLSSDIVSFSDGSTGNMGIFAESAAFPFVNHFAMYASRSVFIPVAGEYIFLIRSDDGARLIIDGETVINDDSTHAVANTVAVVYLEAGMRQIELLYFDAAGQAVVELAAARGNMDDFNLYGVGGMSAITDRVDAVLTLPDFAPQIGGEWSAVVQWPEIPVSAAHLPDGKLLTWLGGTENNFPGTKTTASIYDPVTGSFLSKDHATHNQFCSGIAQMEDGSIFNSGGDPATKKTSRFDIETMSWVTLDEMSYPRWYPTTLTMPDNRIFTAFAKGAGNTSEIYSDELQQWQNTPGASMQSLVTEQNQINSSQSGNGSTDMQWYPFMHVGPNGRVFQSGPMQTMHWFDTEGQGDVEQIGARLGGDQARMFGSAVMYDIGKILITGGNDPSQALPSSNKAITVDLNGAAPVIQEITPMHHKRTFQDSVVLPDGRVMVIGGTTAAKLFSDEGSVFQPEIWDPKTGEWTLVSALTVPRNYHSTALLMKDGRVFAGGGGACGNCDANHQDAQFYSPDYLFNDNGALAVRPEIVQAPAQANAGTVMTVSTSGPVAQFNMIRLQGTTHSINTDQRFVPLEFGGANGEYAVEVNPNPNVMIPGYYWLFAVDEQGVPSEGFAIQILRESEDGDSGDGGDGGSEGDQPGDTTEWAILEPASGTPAARHEADYIAVDERLYLTGGRGSRAVNVYNALTNSWANFGVPRNENSQELRLHHYQSVEVAGRIYILGALVGGYPAETPVGEIYSFHPDTPAQWRVESMIPEGRRRGAAAAANYDGKIYIVGGNTRGHNAGWVPWFDVYDPVAKTWTTLPDAPHARDHHRASVVDRKLYVMAGRRSSVDLGNGLGDTEASVDVYDFETGQWSTLSNQMPTPRAGVALFKHGSELVVAAGESASGDHTEVEALDVGTGTWRSLPSLLYGRNAPGGARFGNELFVVAGRHGNTELSSQEVMTMIPRVWPADSNNDGIFDDEDAFLVDSGEYLDDDTDTSDPSPGDGTGSAGNDGDGDNADSTPDDPALYAMPPLPVLNSTTLAVEPVTDEDRVWVVNPDNNSVSLVIGDQRIAEVAVGEKPSSITLSQDGYRAWVTNKTDATVSVIDTSNHVVINTIDLPAGSQPHGLVRVPGSDDLLVVLEATAELIRLNADTGQVVNSGILSGRPRHLAVSSDGETVYVTNFITPLLPGEDGLSPDVSSGGGELYVLDAQTLLVMETIQLGYRNQPVSESSGPGIPNYLNAPVLGPDGDWAYIPSKQDNILAGAARGGMGITFDQTVRAVTSRVNLATGSENPGVRIDHDNASVATGAVVTADGRYLFVALETSREVAVYNLEEGYPLTRLETGLAPQGLALSADGGRLLIHNFMDRSLQSFGLAAILRDNLPQADSLHTVALVSDETLPPDVLLGKQLFYDAADERLARDSYMSCASCHNDAGHDGRVWDLTSLGEGLRNTIDLIGKGAGHGHFHWTGNANEVQDFEAQIRLLAGGTGLIDDNYFDPEDDPLLTSRAGLSTDMDAIASYLSSLVGHPPSPFYRESLSAVATAGQVMYQRESCASCHSGEQRTDSSTGVLHDIGTLTAGTGFSSYGPVDGIDTPTLDHLWATSPYLHNGGARSIAAAILAHDNVNITEQEAIELELYLLESDAGR